MVLFPEYKVDHHFPLRIQNWDKKEDHHQEVCFFVRWLKIYDIWYFFSAAVAAAKSLQLCLTLCNPIDNSPPGSPVPGILQATTLEWVAISFSNAWKWKVKVKSLSRIRLLATPWTAAYCPPPSMGFPRQEYCSGVPLPSPYKPMLHGKSIQSVSWGKS